jgi:predicted nucleotidyltransferase
MNHDERIAVAVEIAQQLLCEHGNRLLYVGVYGSVFNNADNERSDIDLFAVLGGTTTSTGKGLSWISHRLKDVVLGLGVYASEEVDHTVSTPNYRWPYVVGKFVNNRTIYASCDLKQRYQEAINGVSQQLFVEAAHIEYLEAFSAIRRAYNQVDADCEVGYIRSQALKGLRRLEACIALVNRGFLYGETSFKNIDVIDTFQETPPQYAPLSRTIWNSNDKTQVQRAAEELWRQCAVFAAQNGVEKHCYSSVAEIGTLTRLMGEG